LPPVDVTITGVTATHPNPDHIGNIVNGNPAGTHYRLVGNWTGSNGVTYTVTLKAGDIVSAASRGSATVEGATSGAPQNLFNVPDNRPNVLFANLRVGRVGTGINLGVHCENSTVRNCEIYNCRTNGIWFSRMEGGVCEDTEIHHCGNTQEQGHISGGCKVTASGARGSGRGMTFRRVFAHHNIGQGIWIDTDGGTVKNDGWPTDDTFNGCDQDVGDNFPISAANFTANFNAFTPRGDLFEDCTVSDNTSRGIFYEVSRGPCIIRHCRAFRNNIDGDANKAGIGVSASKNVLVEDNYVTDNGLNNGIRVGQVEREPCEGRPWQPGWYDTRNVIVRNNFLGNDAYDQAPTGTGPTDIMPGRVTVSNNVPGAPPAGW
jgi:hypothetical protein